MASDEEIRAEVARLLSVCFGLLSEHSHGDGIQALADAQGSIAAASQALRMIH